MQEIVDYFYENKKKLFILGGLIIVVVVIMIWMNIKDKPKVYTSDDYVFTKESYVHNSGVKSVLPYINIKGNSASEINNILLKKYYEIITIDEEIMMYDYFVSGNVLSLIVKFYYNDVLDSVTSDILIYNLDIKTGEIIYNDSLFSMFDISSEEANDIILDKIRDYYNYEIDKEYISKFCDFDCYLSMVNAIPIMDNINFYVKNDTLFAYKPLLLDSEFYYDESSEFDLFNYEIKEK